MEGESSKRKIEKDWEKEMAQLEAFLKDSTLEVKKELQSKEEQEIAQLEVFFKDSTLEVKKEIRSKEEQENDKLRGHAENFVKEEITVAKDVHDAATAEAEKTKSMGATKKFLIEVKSKEEKESDIYDNLREHAGDIVKEEKKAENVHEVTKLKAEEIKSTGARRKIRTEIGESASERNSVETRLREQEERLKVTQEEERRCKSEITRPKTEAALGRQERWLLERVFQPRSENQIDRFKKLRVDQWRDLDWEQQKKRIRRCLEEEEKESGEK